MVQTHLQAIALLMDSCQTGFRIWASRYRLITPLHWSVEVATFSCGGYAVTTSICGEGLERSRILALTLMVIKLSRFIKPGGHSL